MYIYVCLQVRCIVLSTITNVSSVNVVSLCIHMTCMNININIILINAGSGFFVCFFYLYIIYIDRRMYNGHVFKVLWSQFVYNHEHIELIYLLQNTHY